MFKKNKRHLQPPLLSDVSQLSEKHRQRLENSWASVFYREVFCRLNEEIFAVLYADLPSRPNVPVNVLVSLEFLKAGFGWSDEELYDAFTYNLQVRYALGYHEFGQGDFELRTLYYFRQRLSQYMQEQGVNLLDRAFEQISDAQIAAHQLHSGVQRMDSTQVASNIRQMSRVQLLVEVLRRVHRMLSETDQAHWAADLAPFLKGHSGHYVYQLKKEDVPEHLQRIGELMGRLLADLAAGYGDQRPFQLLARVFAEHFDGQDTALTPKAEKDLSATSLLSPDDWEATLRGRRAGVFRGYVANLTETCDPQNPLQLITKVQVRPNHVDDPQLLLEALPNLGQRTELETLCSDGGFGSPQTDQAMIDQHVTHLPTAIRGPHPDPEKLSLCDFALQFDPAGTPTHIQCPAGQHTPVEYGNQKKGFVARFDPQRCAQCRFAQQNQCPTKAVRHNPIRHLYFLRQEAWVAQRRRRVKEFFKQNHNLRAAIEATCRAIKCRYPQGKFPVRGLFRMTYLLISSAAMNNVRRIDRYVHEKPWHKKRRLAKPMEQAAVQPIEAFSLKPSGSF